MLLSYKYDTGQTWGHAKTQNMQEQKRSTVFYKENKIKENLTCI